VNFLLAIHSGDGRYKGGSGYTQYGESNRDTQQTIKNKSFAGDGKDLPASAGTSKPIQRDSASQRPRNGPINTSIGGNKQQGSSRIVNGQ
jgi:hypothetical protein